MHFIARQCGRMIVECNCVRCSASVALNGEEAGISGGESRIGLRRAEVAAEEAAAKAPGAAGIVEEVEEIPRAAGAGMQASTSGLADQRCAHPGLFCLLGCRLTSSRGGLLSIACWITAI